MATITGYDRHLNALWLMSDCLEQGGVRGQKRSVL